MSSQLDSQSLQEDLSRLSEWCRKWQLSLNTKKCKAMCITLKKKPPTFTYYINNNTLEWVDTFKYLGILVDNRLKWQAQVEGTVLKASGVLNLLRRTLKDCSMDAKKKAYTALVHPLLEYAAPAWSPHLHRDIDMLGKVQKRAARWVCGPVGIHNINAGSTLTLIFATSLNESCFTTGAHYYAIIRLTKLFMVWTA